MIHYQDDTVVLHHGDCIDVLKTLPDNSIDAVVTDPPYGLEFMGKDWDAPWKSAGAVIKDPATERGGFQDGNGGNPYSRSRIEYGRGGEASTGFQQWCQAWATECLRVLKPGGHILAFGGTRTWHRLAAAIEDAGFEIRDSIAWLYGSGFPKSMDVSKAIDKAAGAQREVVGTVDVGPDMRGDNYGRGTGARMLADITAPATDAARQWAGWGTALKPAFEPIVVGRKPIRGTVAANVLAHGTGALNIDDCRIGDEVRINQPGSTKPRTAMGDGWREDAQPTTAAGRWPTNVLLDDSQAAELDRQSGHRVSGWRDSDASPSVGAVYGNDKRDRTGPHYDDAGGASRFFPTFRYTPKAPGSERPKLDGQGHPTVKPLELMRWLVRLVTPPDGIVLEPFAGSGTTVEACLREGKRCIAIERDDTYLRLIVNRIDQTQLGFDIGV